MDNTFCELNENELMCINGGGKGDALMTVGGVGVGVGLSCAGEAVTAAFLVSNPIGWGILAGSAAVGAGAYLSSHS
ncbi:bacteriocin [Clostridium estertheticum]|uniref:bacteriocin n=1 Tax=Clostridium estertheticum TaxID=238834 RepID=UPI001C0C3941|nr:bacteriocin [Clostridium estertheticum]MBU3199833.1 bacteriocin [Clostridium estertheticum]WAG67066.1 bacteriocin [Clostridium estertheticum]